MTIEEQKWEIIKEISENKMPCGRVSILNPIIIDELAMLKELETLNASLPIKKDKDKQTIIEDKINSIKKQLKHCKNPMENKKLNQELNALYKEKKKQKKYQEKK